MECPECGNALVSLGRVGSVSLYACEDCGQESRGKRAEVETIGEYCGYFREDREDVRDLIV